MLNLPMDGFTLNPTIRYYPNVFYPGALSQMDLLRRANLYRPRWFSVPDDFNQPIPAYGTLEYQIKVGPASYLWGYRFMQFDNSDWSQVVPGSVYIQMTDSCTGIPMFSEFTNGDHAAYDPPSPSSLRSTQLPYLMTQPRLILEPGLVNVELSSVSSSAVYCQLLILFAEPCTSVEQTKASVRRI